MLFAVKNHGMIPQTLLSIGGRGAVPAVIISALLFGALHTLREPGLRLFALWAVWQGILPDAAYVVTGSLLVTMLVHGAHDSLGFVLLALRRHVGRLEKR
jgi:membrane protease YdiL (CAAX protease family)